MKRLLRVLAVVLTSATFSLAASAGPTFEYGFTLDSAECRLGGQELFDCDREPASWIESARVVLSLDALLNNEAHYFLNSSENVIDAYDNFGVVSLHVEGLGDIFDPEHPIRSCGPQCFYDFAFNDISLLSGHLRFSESQATQSLDMSGDRLWSGEIPSDGFPLITFTGGFWRLVRVVPEPDALAILCLGLVGLAFTRRLKTS